jgi:hypothetical protein
MKDEKRKEAKVCYLNEAEINDPYHVLQEFAEDVSLEAVRKLIVTMREICSITENVAFNNPKDREDLFYVTDKMIRFFEASYLELKKLSVRMIWDHPVTRQLKVFEKHILKNVKGVPNTVPYLPLFGKWLATAGFTPGNTVTVVSEYQKLFITLTSEWDKAKNKLQLRA